MSVVVLNMEKPRACIDGDYYGNCPMDRIWCSQRFAPEGRSLKGIFRDQNDKLPDWCPLRPLPEGHGDLIDRKAFEAAMRERQHAAMKWRAEAETEESRIRADAVLSFLCEVKLTLDGIPTIIEAEGE